MMYTLAMYRLRFPQRLVTAGAPRHRLLLRTTYTELPVVLLAILPCGYCIAGALAQCIMMAWWSPLPAQCCWVTGTAVVFSLAWPVCAAGRQYRACYDRWCWLCMTAVGRFCLRAAGPLPLCLAWVRLFVLLASCPAVPAALLVGWPAGGVVGRLCLLSRLGHCTVVFRVVAPARF